MTNLPTATNMGDAIERVIAGGDLAALTPEQRTSYYHAVCDSLGLNPLTRPFEYIRLQGKLTLYARRDATDQLRKAQGISVEIKGRARVDDLYVVTASAHDPNGRADESIGAVSVQGLSGEALANALMKAETKAKRRVTLSICGLGWTDETEVDSIPGAQPMPEPPMQAKPEPPMPEPPVQVQAEPDPPTPAAHWIDNEDTRKRFWSWTTGQGLANAEVHEALGVASVRDYTGTKQAAVAAINSYIEARATAAPTTEQEG